MVFGTLPHLILHKLEKEPHSGYALMKSLEHDLGKKPSFGSIYPTLERLKKQKLITCKIDGRRKIYRLSAKGKQELTAFAEIHGKLIKNMIAEGKACSLMSGKDVEPILELLRRVQRGEEPFGKITPVTIRSRDMLLALVTDGTADKKYKEITKILDDANTKLEKLRKNKIKNNKNK